jgi:hypothetical protein
MSKQKSLSSGLLIASVLLSVLFTYSLGVVRKTVRRGSLTTAAASPTDIRPYCEYRPDWPLFRAGKEHVQHSGSHTGPPDAPGTRDYYEILLPRVNQATTEYKTPQERRIPLKRGDEVTVDACGCVQTGGVGDTWKLYVNPRGKHSDELYHGLIWVQNAAKVDLPFSPKINGYVRISDLMAWQIKDSRNRLRIISDSYLTLGYEDGSDEDYKDNGYLGHDDGNYEQCKGVGGAAVSIVIDHH